ncbi:unnamed protein product [Scytosiphon promiscuus]
MRDDSLAVDRRDESGEEEEEAEGGEQGSDEEFSDGETFFLDPEGRVPFAGDVSFDFRSAPMALTAALSEPEVLARVVRDCQTVFSARAKKLEYSTGETFWMQADAVPRNCLERLALDIFEAHTPDARFDRATSGAEWWTQVIDDSDDIGWHWDKDYGMEANGINVHPCLATVTYLSANGGPTIILEKKGPMECEDVRGVSGESAKAWISRPSLGKHICFDGRFLHAAPADLAVPPSPASSPPLVPPSSSSATPSPSIAAAPMCRLGDRAKDTEGYRGVKTRKRDKDGEPKSMPTAAAADVATTTASTNVSAPRDSVESGGGGGRTSRTRVTFLVNVWLNHAPKTAAPLPGTTAAKLDPLRLPARLSPADFVPPSVLCVRDEEAHAGSAAVAAAASVSGSGTIGDVDGIDDKRGGDWDGTSMPAAGSGDKEEYFATASSVSVATNGMTGGSRNAENGAAAAAEAGTDARGEMALAVDMRWEFGEVGDEAEKHLRHEVVVPVPAALLSQSQLLGQGREDAAAACAAAAAADAETAGGSVGNTGCGGGSFCVKFSSKRCPRVSRISVGGSASEESSSEGSEEDMEAGGEGISEDEE